MTSYSFNLTLSDNESEMLIKALEMMQSKCESEISLGAESPYEGWLYYANEVKSRVHLNPVLLSTSSSCKSDIF